MVNHAAYCCNQKLHCNSRIHECKASRVHCTRQQLKQCVDTNNFILVPQKLCG
jgi:hypothetical protein